MTFVFDQLACTDHDRNIFPIPSTKNRTEPNRTEPEPYIYRTRTEH